MRCRCTINPREHALAASIAVAMLRAELIRNTQRRSGISACGVSATQSVAANVLMSFTRVPSCKQKRSRRPESSKGPRITYIQQAPALLAPPPPPNYLLRVEPRMWRMAVVLADWLAVRGLLVPWRMVISILTVAHVPRWRVRPCFACREKEETPCCMPAARTVLDKPQVLRYCSVPERVERETGDKNNGPNPCAMKTGKLQ
jgi:hypothetical protein